MRILEPKGATQAGVAAADVSCPRYTTGRVTDHSTEHTSYVHARIYT